MNTMLTYLIVYFLIGAVVATTIALIQIQKPSASGQREEQRRGKMLDAYCFVGLAWPVSVMAVVCGSISHYFNRPSNGSPRV